MKLRSVCNEDVTVPFKNQDKEVIGCWDDNERKREDERGCKGATDEGKKLSKFTADITEVKRFDYG